MEKEHFTTTTTTEQQITTAVKKIYLADVEAIRILSNFAIQLSQGGTTVPGNVTFSGDVSVGGKDLKDRPGNWTGSLLRTFDIYSDGSIATGTNKQTNAWINNKGDMYTNTGLIVNDVNHGIFKGTGDDATNSKYNLSINSWWGIGFYNTYLKETNIWFDLRSGTINCRAINIVPKP